MNSLGTDARRLVAVAALMLLGWALAERASAESERKSASPAQWIWSEPVRSTVTSAYFRKRFLLPRGIEKSELHVAADHCSATVYLNGRRIAATEDGRVSLRQDVTRWAQEGENVLAAHANGTGGPAAIAIRVDLKTADGARTAVTTDESWQACPQPVDGWWEPELQPGPDWTTAATFGAIEEDRWKDGAAETAIGEVEDYTQWKQALGADSSTDPSSFLVPDGFEIELLRSAREDEGSWISLAFDPDGRLIIGREDRGLLRLTVSADEEISVETIDDTLQECRGLLWAHESIYVQANSSKALYRLRDIDGDDRFDETLKLYEAAGGLGHGRNGLALGPDGKIYAIYGDAVDLPRNFADRTSPFREHRQGRKTREGHLLRFDPEGGQGEIVASGLRNPYGIAFNPEGELFTYDADAEYDMGAPWYRPTRVLQLVSGADFGWRGVTGAWPPYYPDHPDNAPPVLDIGRGSPTAVQFGTRSQFPPRYREALYILDWAYGRIVAVHLRPAGSGYTGTAETFVKGRPLNVTDLAFGPDGAMYVVTGGRETQSGLYRIRYTGPPVPEPRLSAQQQARSRYAADCRRLRRRLESFHGRIDPDALSVAWPHLDSADPWIRHAARIAIEHQPVETWKERALRESRPTAAVTALLALARSPREDLRPRILSRLNSLRLQEFSATQKAIALHAYRLCLSESDELESNLLAQTSDHLGRLLPDESSEVNQELAQLLVRLDATGIAERVLGLLRSASDERERMHYLFVLREANNGWTTDRRRTYFEELRRLRSVQGGEGMPKFLAQLQIDALAGLNEHEREQFAPLLAQEPPDDPLPQESRPFVRDWKLEDLLDDIAAVGQGRDFERGRRLFHAALCARCHRVGHEGAVVGPDLTSVGRRFSRRDILESILEPSQVVAEQYRLAKIVTKDGRTITGQVVPSSDFRSPDLQIATDPLRLEQLVVIPKVEIELHTVAETSVMPAGLLNTFSREEILDLLAWIEAGGDPHHPNFDPDSAP